MASKETPTTFAPSTFNHIAIHEPLKPVCPVTRIILLLKILPNNLFFLYLIYRLWPNCHQLPKNFFQYQINCIEGNCKQSYELRVQNIFLELFFLSPREILLFLYPDRHKIQSPSTILPDYNTISRYLRL